MKRPELIQPDVLHQRLVRLDEAARRAAHPHRERYALVLRRFSYYRGLPDMGQLVLSLLSTKEEAAILEKERKFFKKSGREDVQGANAQQGSYGWRAGPPHGASGYAQTAPSPQGSPGRWHHGQLQWSQNPYPQWQPRRRQSGPRGRSDECYRCHRLGHIMRDCPQKDR